MEHIKQVEAKQGNRTIWDIECDLDEVLAGLRMAQTTAYLLLEQLSNEKTNSITRDYIDGLYLTEDRIFDERKKFEALIEELGTIRKKGGEIK